MPVLLVVVQILLVVLYPVAVAGFVNMTVIAECPLLVNRRKLRNYLLLIPIGFAISLIALMAVHKAHAWLAFWFYVLVVDLLIARHVMRQP